MTKVLECIYDDGSSLAGKSTVVILEGGRLDLKFVLALLNSKLISFWYKSYYKSLSLAGGYLHIANKKIKTIPVALPSDQQQMYIVDLVDQILASKSLDRDAKTDTLELEIDKIIYHLYGLSDNQILLIQGDVFVQYDEDLEDND